MKAREYRVKREPVKSPGIFRRLSAVTRKQRVAASAAMPIAEYEEEETGSKVSGVLTMIFLLHIVVVVMIFVHQTYVNKSAEGKEDPSDVKSLAQQMHAANNREELPKVAPTDVTYCVKAGDHYGKIASELGVDEQELRVLNSHVDIRQGLTLRVPPKKIVAEEPAEVKELRQKSLGIPVPPTSVLAEQKVGHLEEESVAKGDSAPKAMVVAHKPTDKAVAVDKAPKATPVVEKVGDKKSTEKAATVVKADKGNVHILKDGESIYGLAKKYKVSQDALMKANGITDPKRMRPGMKLTVPVK